MEGKAIKEKKHIDNETIDMENWYKSWSQKYIWLHILNKEVREFVFKDMTFSFLVCLILVVPDFVTRVSW